MSRRRNPNISRPLRMLRQGSIEEPAQARIRSPRAFIRTSESPALAKPMR